MKFPPYLKAIIRRKIFQAFHHRGLSIQNIGLSCKDLDKYFDNLYKEHFKPDSITAKRFYNIGAGRFRHHFWTNVDLRSGSLSDGWRSDDIDFDLSWNKPLPIENDIAEIIYSSHTIEHVRDDSNINLFKEVYRVLREGGLFRIVCPDIDLAKAAYWRNDKVFFQQAYGEEVPSLENGLVRFFATELIDPQSEHYLDDAEVQTFLYDSSEQGWMDLLLKQCNDNLQRKQPDNHINWFNEAKLIKMLNKAGFNKVYRSRYAQSAMPVLRDVRYFDCTLPFMSLYVEAVK